KTRAAAWSQYQNRLALCHSTLNGVERTTSCFVPGKFLRPRQTMLAQAGAERFIGKYLTKKTGYVCLAFRIEQRFVKSDNFRNTRRVSGDGRGATSHRLKHRQTETFPHRWKNEGGAKIVQ